MAVYLTEHPPATAQYRPVRRAKPTGAIVLHTAENAADLNPPDDGAEAIAAFIATRTDPGSYHSVVDSDGILRLGEYGWEMFGEGTGGNHWALHLAAACRTTDWAARELWVHAVLWNMAQEAKAMAAWCKALYGIGVPARRITATEYRAGVPGFITHADIDPTRRSDPGWGDVQWGMFLSFYSEGDVPMATPDPLVLGIQQDLNGAGVQPPLKEDGLLGPKTAQALKDVLSYQQWRMGGMAGALNDIVAKANEGLNPA